MQCKQSLHLRWLSEKDVSVNVLHGRFLTGFFSPFVSDNDFIISNFFLFSESFPPPVIAKKKEIFVK